MIIAAIDSLLLLNPNPLNIAWDRQVDRYGYAPFLHCTTIICTLYLKRIPASLGPGLADLDIPVRIFVPEELVYLPTSVPEVVRL